MSWKKVKLGEFLKVRDNRYKPNNKAIADLRRIDKIDFSGEIFISDKPSNTDMILIKKGDLVISGINVEKGAMAVYTREEDITATIHYSSYYFDENKIDIEFLKYFLKSIEFKNALKEQVPGGIKPEIKPKHLLPLVVEIPTDVIDQRKVVEILKSRNLKVDSISTELTNQLSIIKKLRQQLLQDAVQGKLVKQNPKDGNAKDLLEKIKTEKQKLITEKKLKKEKELPPIKPEEIPFEIPENWTWCRLGEIIQYTENLDIQKHHSSETIINYIDIDAIDNQSQEIREVKQKSVSELSTRARRILKKGYIMFSTVRPYLKNIAVIDIELENFIGSTGFNVFQPILVDLKYVFNFLLTPKLNDKYKKIMGGFNSPSITNEQFEQTLVPLPPLAEQTRIVQKLDELMQYCNDLEASIKQSAEQNEKLLQQVLREALKKEEIITV